MNKETERLIDLLKAREEEYKVFGATKEDLEYDRKIRELIENKKN